MQSIITSFNKYLEKAMDKIKEKVQGEKITMLRSANDIVLLGNILHKMDTILRD